MKLFTPFFIPLALIQLSPRGAAGSSANSRKPLDEPCVALVGMAEGSNGNPGRDFLACETPSGFIYEVPVTGEWLQEKRSSGELRSGSTILELSAGTEVDVA